MLPAIVHKCSRHTCSTPSRILIRWVRFSGFGFALGNFESKFSVYVHCGTHWTQHHFCVYQAWHIPPLLFKLSCDISISFSFVVLSNLSSSNAWNATHASTFRSLWVTSGSISTEGTNYFFWRLCSFAGRELCSESCLWGFCSTWFDQHKCSPGLEAVIPQICEHPLHKAASALAEVSTWPCRSFLGIGYSGSLGRSAATRGEAYSQMHYLFKIFTANSRPRSPK